MAVWDSRHPQLSERPLPQPGASHDQHSFSRNNANNVHSSHLWSIYANQPRPTDHQKTKWELPRKPLQWWSLISPFLRGLLLGVLIGALMLAVATALWLTSGTKTAVTTSIQTTTDIANVPVAATTISLRWNLTGITVAGIVSSPGTASNQLDNPFDLALDTANSLYIADASNNRIQKWTSGASFGTTVAGQASGASGSTSSYFIEPAGVLVDSSGNLYVSDSDNSRIQFWPSGASSGTTIAGTGSSGSANNQFDFPYGIARDWNSGTLYIAEYGNHRVMQYLLNASSGTVVAGGNGPGTLNTQLSYPVGLYLDSSSNSLVIANYGANNIVRWVLGASSWTLVAGSINGSSGSTSTLLNSPVGVTLDSMGNVYVADTLNHRIQLFLAGQSNGTTIAGVTSTNGVTSNLLDSPYSVRLDSQLNLYVADTYNDRIQQFLRY